MDGLQGVPFDHTWKAHLEDYFAVATAATPSSQRRKSKTALKVAMLDLMVPLLPTSVVASARLSRDPGIPPIIKSHDAFQWLPPWSVPVIDQTKVKLRNLHMLPKCIKLSLVPCHSYLGPSVPIVRLRCNSALVKLPTDNVRSVPLAILIAVWGRLLHWAWASLILVLKHEDPPELTEHLARNFSCVVHPEFWVDRLVKLLSRVTITNGTEDPGVAIINTQEAGKFLEAAFMELTTVNWHDVEEGMMV